MSSASHPSPLTGKHLLLGITGGIGAYKAAELVRLLRGAGAAVRVVMTDSAAEFITPLTLQALSGHPVHRQLLDPAAEAGMGHIALARWADAIIVAPASANFMARLAHGLADDLLGTLCLASAAPLALAPAMNRQMWANPATQANRRLLLERGIRLFGPADGLQACGDTGPGRMLEPGEILQQLAGLFGNDRLAGTQVLVSAGPTREAIDPVRYLSNRSSGKMGYAIAQAAVEAGAQVTLISGPTALAAPERVRLIAVTSAADMQQAVLQHAPDADIFIAAAAVADYTVRHYSPGKIKKADDALHLDLIRTPDILHTLSQLPGRPFTVGFAAETEHLEAHAQAKRAAKNLDMIAANRVDRVDRGFDSDANELHIFWEGGDQLLPLTSKPQLAHQLITLIAHRYHAKNSTQDS